MFNIVKHKSIEETFLAFFETDKIQEAYINDVAVHNITGIDRLNVPDFEKQKDFHFHVINKKCQSGEYRFSSYLEVLKSKGRGKFPRVISIPTVRDRIVLSLLKIFLHETFADCVNRVLPNTRVRQIAAFFQDKNYLDFGYVKADIESFYDTIVHETLMAKLSLRIDSANALKLIGASIRNPTISANYRAPKTSKKNPKGVPQGLAISNILAEIYLNDFDLKIKLDTIFFQRYVDDILVFVEPSKIKEIKNQIEIELINIGLKLNSDKSKPDLCSSPFEYLGYRFNFPTITVRQTTVDRFIASIAGMFTAYRKGFSSFFRQHPNFDAEVHREVFIEDLNEKITGALSDNRRYGWIFYFNEINDSNLLHKIDSIINSFFYRLDDFQRQPPPSLKSLAKAYYYSKFDLRSGYIHDFSKFDTIEAKSGYLTRRGYLNPDVTYKREDIEKLFDIVKRKHLNKLEMDVGTFS